MSLPPGNYSGTIVGHGTDTNQNGLPFVFFDVEVHHPHSGESEVVTCRAFLASGAADPAEREKKSATAIRMSRAILKLCGFDPDARELTDLDTVSDLLRGNTVPVSVRVNGQFTNYDIQLPRGVTKAAASDLTSALRAAKSKDEAPVAFSAKATTPPDKWPSTAPAAAAPAPASQEDEKHDDIPF